MPSGGEDLSRPPVRVWNRAAAAELATMLAGANLYSMGAGGFSTVPAIPQLVRLKQPARPGRAGCFRRTSCGIAGTVEKPPAPIEYRFAPASIVASSAAAARFQTRTGGRLRSSPPLGI